MAPNLLTNNLLIAGSCLNSEAKSTNGQSENTAATTTVINRNNNKFEKKGKNSLNIEEDHIEDDGEQEPNKNSNAFDYFPTFQTQIVWRNIIAFLYLHIGALYGLYLLIFYAKPATIIFSFIAASFGAFGITAGAHRLWSHKSYKAKWPLRFFLMILQTLAFQNSIYEWVRDHRVHHKYSDTDADPHNSKRGFFFSHVGWLMMKKHPDVKEKGKQIDMSDLEEDSVVMFQKKYYLILMPLCSFVIPTIIPMYFWNETLSNAYYIASILRYTLSLNATWLVNSAAHIWGMKPFDRNISPTDNKLVAIAAFGEGWHNYHHVFPWDYKTSELGDYGFNFTTAFIDFFTKFGMAFDLKTVSEEMIMKRVLRTGDGSHRFAYLKTPQEKLFAYVNDVNNNESIVWGWDDQDMDTEDKKEAKIINKTQ